MKFEYTIEDLEFTDYEFERMEGLSLNKDTILKLYNTDIIEEDTYREDDYKEHYFAKWSTKTKFLSITLTLSFSGKSKVTVVSRSSQKEVEVSNFINNEDAISYILNITNFIKEHNILFLNYYSFPGKLNIMYFYLSAFLLNLFFFPFVYLFLNKSIAGKYSKHGFIKGFKIANKSAQDFQMFTNNIITYYLVPIILTTTFIIGGYII